MNSEVKIQIGGKQGKEWNRDRFLERNDEDRRRHALVSLLFSSLLFSSLLFLSPIFSLSGHGNNGWRHREGKG
jgi:hypothetical protein